MILDTCCRGNQETLIHNIFMPIALGDVDFDLNPTNFKSFLRFFLKTRIQQFLTPDDPNPRFRNL